VLSELFSIFTDRLDFAAICKTFRIFEGKYACQISACLPESSRLFSAPSKKTVMKADIHPEYNEATIQCNCGNVIQTRSTVADLHIGICSACHPFFTGEQRFVDTAGRVDKFQQRFGEGGGAGKRRKKPKLSDL
jgi:large subunit ribosomal protein L31